MSSRVGNYEVIAPVAETALGTLSVARALVGDERGRLALLRRLQRGQPLGDADLAGVREAAIRALRIHDAGVLAVLELLPVEDGLVIVSEYIEGLPLRLVLDAARDRGAPLPASVAVRLGTDLLRALLGAKRALAEAAVMEPLVGLTPDGVLLASSGDVMISGLGLAMLARPIDLPVLLAYRAPEQFSGAPPDERSEVYSVGVLLWELLAGRNPLAESLGLERAALVNRIRTVGLPRLDRAASSSLSPAVAELVMQAVARDPAHRIPTLATLSSALTALGKSNTGRVSDVLKAVQPLVAEPLARQRAALEAAQQLSRAPESGPAESVRPTFRPPAPTAIKTARPIGLAAFPRPSPAPRIDPVDLGVESARQVDDLLAPHGQAPAAALPAAATGPTRTGIGPQAEGDRRELAQAVSQLRDLAKQQAADAEAPTSVSVPAWSGRASPFPADDVDALRSRPGRKVALALLVVLLLGGSVAIGLVAFNRMQAQQTTATQDGLPGLPAPSVGVARPTAAAETAPGAAPEETPEPAASGARQRARWPGYRPPPRAPLGAVEPPPPPTEAPGIISAQVPVPKAPAAPAAPAVIEPGAPLPARDLDPAAKPGKPLDENPY